MATAALPAKAPATAATAPPATDCPAALLQPRPLLLPQLLHPPPTALLPCYSQGP